MAWVDIVNGESGASVRAKLNALGNGPGNGLFENGTAAVPGIGFASNAGLGIYRVGLNVMALTTASTFAIVINELQQTGIGEDDVATRLDVRGGFRVRDPLGSQIYLGDLNFSGAFGLRGPGIGAVDNVSLIKGDLGFFVYDNVSNRVLRYTVRAGGELRPAADNTQDLGSASFRMATIYAGTGTINTSDEREKIWRGELEEAEMRAAARIHEEIGIFQWKDSVEAKGGDTARLHTGVRAQRVFAILTEEGLDWRRYGWCCYDEWVDEIENVMAEVPVQKTRQQLVPSATLIDPVTGGPVMVIADVPYTENEWQETGETRIVKPAGDRYGIRFDQLYLWLSKANAQRTVALEQRLAAIEQRLAAL